MISGRLNKRIVVEHTEMTRDMRTGEEIPVRSTFIARADVVYGRQQRADENGTLYLSSEITFILWLHYRKRIGETDRILYQDKRYRITGIEPDESKMMLNLKCITDNV